MPRFIPVERHDSEGALTKGAPSLFSGDSALSLLPARAPRAMVDRAQLGPLTLGRVVSTGHEVALGEPLAWSLVFPLAGVIVTEVDGRTLRAQPGQGLLLGPGRRRTRVTPPGDGGPFRGVPLMLPASAITTATRPGRLIDASRARADAQALRLGRLLFDEVATGTGLLDRPGVAESWSGLLADILSDLLQDRENGAHTSPDSGRHSARRVRAAEAYMRAHLATIATIRDVAGVLGVSVRTLESAFVAVHGIPPARYLALLRLEAARALLLAPAGPASVIEVCRACGIGHPGRFAAAYKARYGEAPSDSLRRC